MASDPLVLVRNWVTEWEKLVNQHGAQLLAKPEVAQAMHGISAAGLQAQGTLQEVMAKALAAANIPSKSDVEVIASRLTAIEAALARLEAAQPKPLAPAAPVAAAPPAPRRTRQPGA